MVIVRTTAVKRVTHSPPTEAARNTHVSKLTQNPVWFAADANRDTMEDDIPVAPVALGRAIIHSIMF